jgi:hypothetical protein
MPDGYRTLITFRLNPAIQLWEKTVKPPGFDGGDKIDTTTMHNDVWRTYEHRALKTLTDVSASCAYDPDVYPGILELLNDTTVITIRYPDHSTLCFWGFLQKAEVQEHKEGEMPMINITVTPTNWDPNTFTEEAPVFTAAAGT